MDAVPGVDVFAGHERYVHYVVLDLLFAPTQDFPGPRLDTGVLHVVGPPRTHVLDPPYDRLVVATELWFVDSEHLRHWHLLVWPFQYVAHVYAGGGARRKPQLGVVQFGAYGGHRYAESVGVLVDGLFELPVCASFVSTDASVSSTGCVERARSVCEKVGPTVSTYGLWRGMVRHVRQHEPCGAVGWELNKK